MKDIHSFVILAHDESDDLEECIKSIKKQSVKTNVLIATSTKNDYIVDLASEYGLGVMINDNPSNKGNDYNFALDAVNTKLVTIVHQDDLYDRNYAKEVISCYKKHKDASIIFTNYYEIVGDKKIKKSKTLLRKRIFIRWLKYDFLNNRKYFKRLALKYHNAICTSSVTFVKKNIVDSLFPDDLNYYNDWLGFEKLSLLDKRFVYIKTPLVGYRKDELGVFNSSERHKERVIAYKKFWPSKLVDYFCKEKSVESK